MEKIVKKNGAVYLVKDIDAMGKHKTIIYLGLDYDEKPKKKSKKTKNEDEV